MSNKYFIKNIGLLKASGKDLIDFINRMSTNDFKKFPAEEFRKTVLTSDKGRILDLINVLNITPQPFILTSDNFQKKIISHLDKYIIMDDVVLEKVNDNYSHIVITGENPENVSKLIFGIEAEKNKIYKLDGEEFLFIDNFKIESLNIICKENNLEKYKNLLKDFTEQQVEEYELMRIDAGLPEGSNEFNDQINPLECGLTPYVSFTKGCYIGQEVVARLDSQGKIPKQMVKVNSQTGLTRDDKIFSDEKEVGFVSSAVSNNGKNSALGFIRSVNLDFGKQYIAQHEGQKIELELSSN